MKLGVIVPTIMAVVVFHETLTLTSIAGICLALISVVIINQNPNEVKNQNVSYQFSLLLILLAAGGFTDSIANIYVYPVYNIGTIVFVTITGMIFFKERLSLNKWIAMGIIFLALFLLSI